MNVTEKSLRDRLESLYKMVDELAEATGKKELAKVIGERNLQNAINATFFDTILLEAKRGDPVLKDDLTLTLLVAASMLKH